MPHNFPIFKGIGEPPLSVCWTIESSSKKTPIIYLVLKTRLGRKDNVFLCTKSFDATQTVGIYKWSLSRFWIGRNFNSCLLFLYLNWIGESLWDFLTQKFPKSFLVCLISKFWKQIKFAPFRVRGKEFDFLLLLLFISTQTVENDALWNNNYDEAKSNNPDSFPGQDLHSFLLTQKSTKSFLVRFISKFYRKIKFAPFRVG